MGSVRKSPRNPARWEARYRDASGRQRTKTFSPGRTLTIGGVARC